MNSNEYDNTELVTLQPAKHALRPALRSGRRLVWVVATSTIAVLSIAFAVWGLRERHSPLPAAPTASALTVTEALARTTEWPTTLDATGAIAPWQEAVVGSQTSGLRIAELHVGVGDVVRRGQLLARFDAAMLRADEAQLLAGVAQAESLAAQADANRERALQLKGSGGISEQEILQYVTQAATARAQVDSARAQLNSKRLQLRHADVIAPDDGEISARSATLGAVASSGQELFRLVRQSRLEWRGELTAGQIAAVTLGQSVSLALPDGGTAQARIRQIAPLLDERSRLGVVYADIAPGSTARGGMYASGQIALTTSNALVVPASSVVIRDGRSFVFRLIGSEATRKVRAQAVTTGRRRGTEIEILQNLAQGDHVVAQGAGLLNDGDTVRVASPSVTAPLAALTLNKG
ncbi:MULTISPECIES: efflux RND transporter periplasmic adaptor subunit [unclassified Variovorax]|uniref:efflux RND transporter periplasmic adaptor subunit n=1 Tax=unclassified Variovorax TaxID=663243 RepID=UPI0008AB11B7|nr:MULTISPECIES: efflux RND transporter periplasmic adaptor subunit [unclassified Variovorax]SEK13353.1 RND family efflux transporter, MFP subunit [Variovorax sp. OK202]SFD85969.1 RND family efflux transporter, MFP subunit [Variovorax sp. OK212]